MDVLVALDTYLAEMEPLSARGAALAAIAKALALTLTDCEPQTAPATARELRATLADLHAVEASDVDAADAWLAGMPTPLRHAS